MQNLSQLLIKNYTVSVGTKRGDDVSIPVASCCLTNLLSLSVTLSSNIACLTPMVHILYHQKIEQALKNTTIFLSSSSKQQVTITMCMTFAFYSTSLVSQSDLDYRVGSADNLAVYRKTIHTIASTHNLELVFHRYLEIGKPPQ